MKVLTLDDLNGNITEAEIPAGEFIDIVNYIDGLTIQSTSPSSIRINRGKIFIKDAYHYLPYYKNIPISSMPIFDEVLTERGLFYIYVRYRGGGELQAEDFYLSQTPPNADVFGKHYDYLNMSNYGMALYPYGYPDYRCIGCLYAFNIDTPETLEFDLAYMGYWESKWYDFDDVNFKRNSYNTLNHGLGFNPKSWNVWFKPELDLTAYVCQNYHSTGGWVTNTRGIMIGKFITKDSINIRTGKRIYYYDYDGYSGWFRKGFIKWIVRAF